MPTEFITEPAGLPLKRLESGNKDSTDLESDLTEDKQTDEQADERVQPLSSGELLW
jgi:hypothetical protein